MNTASAAAKRMPKAQLLSTIQQLQKRLVEADRAERYLRERLHEETGDETWMSVYDEDR